MKLGANMALLDDFCLYDKVNLKETVEYCIPRNRVLLNKSIVEVQRMFLAAVIEDMTRLDRTTTEFIGKQKSVYNAFYFLDIYPPGVTLKIGNKEFGAGTFELNFFVRLGREKIQP